MAVVKIDTEKVAGLAGKIRNSNNEMQRAFENAASSVNALGNSWSGAAYGNAIASFNDIRSKYYDARYNGVNNYANILNNQMSGGYNETETANKSLADQFK